MNIIQVAEDAILAVQGTQNVVAPMGVVAEPPEKEDEEQPWQEASTENGLIPDSWVDDNGTRHAVVHSPSLPEYMRLEKVDNNWKLILDAPF